MTRHSKNNTASSVYSYHERQRDTKQGSYGTQHHRLSKDSVKDFNACNLSLQACRNPVITPEGFLYDKESILEYIIKQKAKINRNLKRYEKEKQKEQIRLKELQESETIAKVQKFFKRENNVVDGFDKEKEASTSKSNVSNMDNGKDKQLPSFWIPNLTPSDKETIHKPSTVVVCPMSGKPLKASHLIPIEFTLADPEITDPRIAHYKCAVSGDILTNSSRCVVLRTSHQ
ncbi:hypothetical protein SSS_00397 [Sarcoptes scabiei]|nr:hypothetical protein SSS_00397 [Sarcoptes scabiei]